MHRARNTALEKFQSSPIAVRYNRMIHPNRGGTLLVLVLQVLSVLLVTSTTISITNNIIVSRGLKHISATAHEIIVICLYDVFILLYTRDTPSLFRDDTAPRGAVPSPNLRRNPFA